MRVRDLQQILGKFTNGQKGTIYLIVQSILKLKMDTTGRDYERFIELQESSSYWTHQNPARIVLKALMKL